MANLVVSALSTWDNSGLKKGSKEISAFDKNVKKLGKTFAKTFAGYKLLQFGKASVNAFIASEKAAAQLRTTVDNLGLAYQQPAISDYIKKLELQYGIVDENLIPGFQRLLVATKDVSQAQSIFQTAMDISAATGKDLTEVSTTLSKAYLNDTTALSRLGIGLSKAQLKGAKFVDVQKQLNATFSGQATAAASGYVGEMNKLTVAVDQSKEAIGKGLLDALKTLSGDTSINTFTANMVKSADVIAGAFNSIARLISTVIPGNVVKVDGKYQLKSELKGTQQSAGTRVKDYQLAIKTTAARKAELAIITKSNASKTAIDKLKDQFDLERISLTAALNSATDEETKLRLKAQLAILDNNQALASKYLKEMEAASSAQVLSTALGETAKTLTQTLMPALFTAVGELTARAGRVLPPIETTSYGVSSGSSGGNTSVNTTVTVNPSGGGTNNPSAQDIEQTVQEAMLSLYRQGRNVVPAGSL